MTLTMMAMARRFDPNATENVVVARGGGVGCGLHIALRNAHHGCALALARAGANVNAPRPEDGGTPLRVAFHGGHVRVKGVLSSSSRRRVDRQGDVPGMVLEGRREGRRRAPGVHTVLVDRRGGSRGRWRRGRQRREGVVGGIVDRVVEAFVMPSVALSIGERGTASPPDGRPPRHPPPRLLHVLVVPLKLCWWCDMSTQTFWMCRRM